MATTMHELGIDKWSLDDRLNLAHELWDSIVEGSGDAPLSEDLRNELDRRVAELDANPVDIDTWDRIKEYVRRKR